MIRVILLTIAGLIIYSIWKSTMRKYDRFREHVQKREPVSKSGGELSELVQDPVCKLYIAKNSAIQYKDQYFCCVKCRDEYINNSNDVG